MKAILLVTLLMTNTASASTMPTDANGINEAASRQPVPNFQAAQSAGYIVTARYAADIRHYYARYGIRVLRDLGAQHFELQLDQDPGLVKLQEIAATTKGAISAIQENQTYLSF